VSAALAPLHPDPAIAARYRHHRLRVFASTWLCYAGFYFCRHAFFVAKGDLTKQVGLDAVELASVGIIYLICYAIGEFNAAALGSRFGARRVLLGGMTGSVIANLAFGLARQARSFKIFMALNGLSQATGWSGTVGTMAHWFRRRERGRVMGIWSTCYQIGGVLAKSFAALMLGVAGLRWGFWGAASVLILVIVIFFLLQRNRPEDVGLPPLEDEEPTEASAPRTAAPARFDASLVVTIAMMGCFYFFVKTIRYALWSWAPYFLQLNFGLANDQAGYFSAIFDLCGFVGVVVAGFLSDRVFHGRRAGVAFVMVLGLAASTLSLWLLGANSLPLFGVSIGLCGFMLYGPDSLITGAGAIDVGSAKFAIAAAGIINGMGSLGPILQEAVIGNLYKRDPSNLAPILALLSGSALAATVMMGLLLLRARAGKCNL
jgi:OPA family sugar phosphate sensor protein UhpC-like MFS transporter